MLKHYYTNNSSNLFHNLLKTKLRNHTHYAPISPLHNLNNPAIQFILDETKDLKEESSNSQFFSSRKEEESSFNVVISHPWPEWVQLMGKLLKNGYFEGIGNPFGNSELGNKECNQIRSACLNFARDRFHLIRYLSRQDIKVVAGSGCPSIDRKVVNSSKRLRAHVGIEEGNVCSSCILRGSCERAYVKAREDEGGRTVDVMRLLVAYGLDPITSSMENKPSLNKMLNESTRNLLKEMVELSNEDVGCDPVKTASIISNLPVQRSIQGQIDLPTKQGDWICPSCNFSNFARNIKCLRCDGISQERLTKLRQEQEHLPLKKGDWTCEKCHFLNFAKNTRCFQCKENPPKRELKGGEWECDSCNYINFRKNMVCLKCDHKRPKASNPVNTSSQPAKDISYRRTRPIFGEEKQSTDDRVNTWKFVESESEDHDYSNLPDQRTRFVDFPVVGGKSYLSRNMYEQEVWKSEMAIRSNSGAKARETADQFKSSIIRRNSEYLQCSDDEDMADWFGHGNEKSENIESGE